MKVTANTNVFYRELIGMNGGAEQEYAYALEYFEARRYEQAIAHLNRAILQDPSRAAYWTLRGRCYQQLGYTTLALADFERAAQLNH